MKQSIVLSNPGPAWFWNGENVTCIDPRGDCPLGTTGDIVGIVPCPSCKEPMLNLSNVVEHYAKRPFTNLNKCSCGYEWVGPVGRALLYPAAYFALTRELQALPPFRLDENSPSEANQPAGE